MNGLAITSKGIENTAAVEIKELIGADSKIEEGCVTFDFNGISELCLLCYKCQSADRIIYLIGDFEFKNFFEEFEKFINKTDFNEWTDGHKKFKVECIRLGMHEFNSVDVETKAGQFILKKSKGKKIQVDMKDCELIFFVYISNNKCYFGIDFCGFELYKRGYKIFTHSSSLRSTIAYALIRESGFKKKESMIDPFSRDGVIPIEAAFYANDFPASYYKKDKFAFLKLKLDIDFEKFFLDADKSIKKKKSSLYSFDHSFKYVDYSRKNAKIAGVDKQINFSRVELEWLDIKFKKESIDRAVTSPLTSKSADLNKIYNEFFYQCEYILKKKGTIAVISKMPDLLKNYALKHNFKILREKDVWMGEQLLKITVFEK